MERSRGHIRCRNCAQRGHKKCATAHPGSASKLIDLLMGLFRGAVFRHGGGARKQPIKQPTEMPTSTMALMGRFPSLMGRFPTLMGRFTDLVPRGRFTFEIPLENSPLREGALRGSWQTLGSRLSEELQSLPSHTCPSGPDPLRTLPPDLMILACFWPDSGPEIRLFRSKSGQNQLEREELGP